MNWLIRFFTPSVDAIINDFNKVLKRLENVRVHHTTLKGGYEEAKAELDKSIAVSDQEIERADRLIKKFGNLIE